METHNYICKYCKKEFVPTRRRVQKYCKASCRSGAHQLRKRALSTTKNQLVETEKKPAKIKVEEISVSGVGNAALGTVAADLTKSIFTRTENKPATKGDLSKLQENLIGRYHKIANMNARIDGALPYFDMETKEVVYFGGNNFENLVV